MRAPGSAELEEVQLIPREERRDQGQSVRYEGGELGNILGECFKVSSPDRPEDTLALPGMILSHSYPPELSLSVGALTYLLA